MSQFDSLMAWLNYFEHRHRVPIQLGLERFRRALLAFDLSFEKALVITVGGTNGKGSTVNALDAIYTTAGYRVGRYTSPHLFRFNERICVAAEEVSDASLCRVFEKIHTCPESLSLTYFEITTLAALLLFEEAQLDVIILEVGMGGRLDATNAIDADLSIITTVDLDHQAWLGETVELIGAEKAGILRSGKPALYADHTPPLSVRMKAKALGVHLLCLNESYDYFCTDDHLILSFDGECMRLPKPHLHPHAAAAAVVATQVLKSKYPVSRTHLIKAIQEVRIVGRQQWIEGDVVEVYDVAHNPQAVALLAQSVARYESRGRVRAVFSALKDKDLPGLIRPMAPLVDDWYPAVLSGPRQAPQEMICFSFEQVQCRYKKCYNTPVQAYDAARREAEKGDVIVVFGSFLTVSAVLSSH